MSIPPMQAVRVASFKGLDSVSIEPLEPLSAVPGELVVEVKAAGVNPVDWKLADGMGKGMIESPYTMGCELAGVVVEAGEGKGSFEVGHRVAAFCRLDRCGAFASQAAVHLDEAAVIPDGVDFEQAASLVIGGLTAWQALFDEAELKDGQSVLVHGAAGAVGSMAVQIAKQRGHIVFATASKRNEDYLLSLGVDRFINYRDTHFETVVRNVDVVLDTVGGDTQERSHKVLKEGGHLVSIVSPPEPKLAKRAKVTSSMAMVKPNRVQLQQILQLAAEGMIKARVDRTYPLTDALEALQRSEAGEAQGKLVLLP